MPLQGLPLDRRVLLFPYARHGEGRGARGVHEPDLQRARHLIPRMLAEITVSSRRSSLCAVVKETWGCSRCMTHQERRAGKTRSSTAKPVIAAMASLAGSPAAATPPQDTVHLVRLKLQVAGDHVLVEGQIEDGDRGDARSRIVA